MPDIVPKLLQELNQSQDIEKMLSVEREEGRRQQAIATIVLLLKQLSPTNRKEVFGEFCLQCGIEDRDCFCS